MPANTAPIFTATPKIGKAVIPTTNAVAKSDGSSTGSGTSMLYNVFATGTNGSYVDRVRFIPVASTPTNSVATTLRVYLSTVASPGATTTSDTWLLAEVSVPAIPAANSVNAAGYFDVNIGLALPTGYYIHVCQHVAQTTNGNWNAICFGGDY